MSRFAPHLSRHSRASALLAAAAVLGGAAMLGSPGAANAAQPASEAPRTIVYYNARELATEWGTRALYQRIVSAARTVCPAYDSRDLAAFALSRLCQQRAVTAAIRQVGNRRLAALHAAALPRRG